MQDKLKVNVSSSADVDGHLEANQLDISVGSSGSFSGKVWADYARFEVSSSGDFSVDGKVQHGSIHASSSGDFNGRNLEVKKESFMLHLQQVFLRWFLKKLQHKLLLVEM